MDSWHWQQLFDERAGDLEDFWGRQPNHPRQRRAFHVFGHPVVLAANDAAVLAALDYSLPLFSQAPEIDRPPFTVDVVVRPMPTPPGESVDEVVGHILYTGAGAWIAIDLGPWGQAFAEPAAGWAVAIVTPELAARPDLLSLTLLNTILLNFCLANGYGMLHASCLWREDRALLLMAPHNSGKSTTALRLVLAGYALVSDSMIHVAPERETDLAPLLAGFPTRRIKLRADMLDAFAPLRPFVQAERVRDEIKYVLDLARVDPTRVVTAAVRPSRVTLCLLTRTDEPATTWRPASADEIAACVMANSLFYDTTEVWQRNLTAIDRLLAHTRGYHLAIGRDPEKLVAAVERLWSAG